MEILKQLNGSDPVLAIYIFDYFKTSMDINDAKDGL